MDSRALLSFALVSTSVASSGCAAKTPPAPAAATTEVTVAAPPSATTAGRPEVVAAPPLLGKLFLTITDTSGYVYLVNDPASPDRQAIDVHAVEACYTGYVAAHPHAVPGLPGWVRYRATKNVPGGTTTVERLGDSGLPEALRNCLQTAFAKTTWSADTADKQLYLSLR